MTSYIDHSGSRSGVYNGSNHIRSFRLGSVFEDRRKKEERRRKKEERRKKKEERRRKKEEGTKKKAEGRAKEERRRKKKEGRKKKEARRKSKNQNKRRPKKTIHTTSRSTAFCGPILYNLICNM